MTAAHESEVRLLVAEVALLRAERDEAQAEVDRLRKLFDDAGQGEHNVLALIDHYQAWADAADERLAERLAKQTRTIRRLLEDVGCDCECAGRCGTEHDDDCERCLACRIEIAMLSAGAP